MTIKQIIPLVQQIDALLPQTQCGKCGHPGCKPYAQAIAEGTANINQCPPGGDANIHRLAALTQRPYLPLNPENGVEKPRQLAVIDEQVCIGCTLCIQACPVDAIVGAAKQMHTVIAVECTGCELCIAPCPVDCISMVDTPPAMLDTPSKCYGSSRQIMHVIAMNSMCSAWSGKNRSVQPVWQPKQ